MDPTPDLFTRLGGTRAIAEKLGEAPSTVQSWKASGRIPAHKQPVVIDRFAAFGIEVTAEDVVWPLGRPILPTHDDSLTPSREEAA